MEADSFSPECSELADTHIRPNPPPPEPRRIASKSALLLSCKYLIARFDTNDQKSCHASCPKPWSLTSLNFFPSPEKYLSMFSPVVPLPPLHLYLSSWNSVFEVRNSDGHAIVKLEKRCLKKTSLAALFWTRLHDLINELFFNKFKSQQFRLRSTPELSSRLWGWSKNTGLN